ncbi:MAG: type II toxin-antitoxin system Phd/YefM family antitoxin [Mycolicibacterium sp.]|uniref:type II toxin-antitoxin system Phd/YefM family antitoxin n=1 Tax=Mycolicibacterium sp. TaxID=2320850 RepID=UPI003D14657F
MMRIGVRELRQYTTRYLDRVEAGEIIEITNHGRPVARLMPVDTDPHWEALITTGEIHQAQRPHTELLDPQ